MADITITPSAVFPSAAAQPIRGIAGAAVLAGDVVALDATGKVVPADANGVAPISTPVGIAANSAPGIGQYVMYITDDPDFAVGGTTVPGTPYFLSANPGKIGVAADLIAGMKTSLVGFGKTTSTMVLHLYASGVTV
jgi:hypothetical protein